MNQKFIPLSVPNLKGNELKYMTDAIETEWVSTVGSYVEQFERELANYVGVEQAVSCQNGTSGLHLALLVCDVGADDLVFAPALTFIAAVNPICYVHAEPIFMDCDDSLCLDPVKLRKYCTEECTIKNGVLMDNQTGKGIKAVVVVHVFGNMAKMEEILSIAQEFHLKVIEDATEALGTYYTGGALQGKFAGTMGDVGVYSFNGNKIMTTGGGGMLVSPDPAKLKRAKHLSTQAKSDELYYTHDEIGYNYRMTNIQAALGVAQLEQLETFINTKAENYQHYQEGISAIDGLELLPFCENIRSNYWFYSISCDNYYKSRDELLQWMQGNKVQGRPIWGLICQQKPYESCREYEIELAEKYYEHIINIPCSSNLSKIDVEIVLEVLSKG